MASNMASLQRQPGWRGSGHQLWTRGILCALERQAEEPTAFHFVRTSNCNVDGRAVSHASCIRFGCGGPQRRMAWRLQEGAYVQVAYDNVRAHSATCVPPDPAAALSTA